MNRTTAWVLTSVATMTALVFLTGAGLSATLRVAPDGSGPYPTIQAAIDAATTGDVVELEDGVFSGAGNRDVSFAGKAITVRSHSGDPAACIIDCGGRGDTLGPHRAFAFRSRETQWAVLSDLTMRNGRAQGA